MSRADLREEITFPAAVVLIVVTVCLGVLCTEGINRMGDVGADVPVTEGGQP